MNYYIKAWQRCTDFSGVSTRREYWMFVLVNFLIQIGIGLLISVYLASNVPSEKSALAAQAVMGLYSLVHFLPGLALLVRRLRDAGKSPWLLFLLLVPFVGSIIIFVFTLMPSKSKDNEC